MSKEPNHTPGPWSVQEEDGSYLIHYDGALDMDKIVCSLAEGRDTEANARLIAAAPELIAALENLLSRAALPADVPENSVSRHGLISAREQALAAIAQAKGVATP